MVEDAITRHTTPGPSWLLLIVFCTQIFEGSVGLTNEHSVRLNQIRLDACYQAAPVIEHRKCLQHRPDRVLVKGRNSKGKFEIISATLFLGLKTTSNCPRTNRSITQLDVTWIVSKKRSTKSNTPPSRSPTRTTTQISVSGGLWELALRGPGLRCRQKFEHANGRSLQRPAPGFTVSLAFLKVIAVAKSVGRLQPVPHFVLWLRVAQTTSARDVEVLVLRVSDCHNFVLGQN